MVAKALIGTHFGGSDLGDKGTYWSTLWKLLDLNVTKFERNFHFATFLVIYPDVLDI